MHVHAHFAFYYQQNNHIVYNSVLHFLDLFMYDFFVNVNYLSPIYQLHGMLQDTQPFYGTELLRATYNLWEFGFNCHPSYGHQNCQNTLLRTTCTSITRYRHWNSIEISVMKLSRFTIFTISRKHTSL